MQFTELIKLPKDCQKIISKFKKKNNKNLKGLFDLVKRNGKLNIKYSMASFKNMEPSKLPKEVWKTKSGHCYELSLFLLACLNFLNFNAYYCEMPNFQKGDHACVAVRLNKKLKLLDPGRAIFAARYKKYRKLNEKQTIGNYYVNCAFMFYPGWNSKRMSKKEKTRLSKKSIKYAKWGLQYDPKSTRGKEIVKANLEFLDKL